MLGRQIKNMTFEEELGHGVLGTTYLARSGPSHCIVKLLEHDDYYYLLRTSYGSKRVNLAADGLFGFRQLGFEDGVGYLKTVEIRGRSVADMLNHRERQGITTVIELLTGASKTVDEIHKRGVVHGGIKPGNIFMTRTGDAVVSDCGHVEAVRRLRPEAYEAHVKTPKNSVYIAPEAHRVAGTLTESADVYGLGAVLYALSMQARERPVDPPKTLTLDHAAVSAELPESLAAVIVKATAEDLTERYGSAASFTAALQALDTAQIAQQIVNSAGRDDLQVIDLELDGDKATASEIGADSDATVSPESFNLDVDDAPSKAAAPRPAFDPFAPPAELRDDMAAPDSQIDPFAPPSSTADPFAPAAAEDPYAATADFDPFAPPAAKKNEVKKAPKSKKPAKDDFSTPPDVSPFEK